MIHSQTEPTILLSTLPRADGSATTTENGFTIIGAVNGPLEISRRDENPEAAVVDVTIRPAVGSAGTRERHLESILQSTLRQIILIYEFPRTLIQVTLQISTTPENDDDFKPKGARAGSNLFILPALLQTATMALISASIPLSLTINSTCIARLTSPGSPKSVFQRNPTIAQANMVESLHVMAFTSNGELLLAESEGVFSMTDWNQIYELGRETCCKVNPNGKVEGVVENIKTSLQSQISVDLRWKQ
ncbi:putative exosome complex subunit rrp46 [Erysiphe necator]|uniref:Putative exosome complex subunit rrp46 n=1 Tax=Uncinula necator TaxID=52586 RepID=A0A0B1P5V9_UNCNE|nr:putative exosome complex subunit rrp46 [Erysiphe necator]